MNKKLTLNVDERLIDFAHNYAQRTNQSISSLIEKYLIRLQEDLSTETIAPEAHKVYGILENENILNKESIRKLFYEKSFY